MIRALLLPWLCAVSRASWYFNMDLTTHEKYVIEKSRGCSSGERNGVYGDVLNILEKNWMTLATSAMR
eukprot:11244301-Heterocapsa_arctica.AAC.1